MFAGMTKAQKLKTARSLWEDAVDRDAKWQSMAREDFSFRDGYQWTSEEKQILEEELRPVLTMNLTKSSCDLIMGMNEDTKMVFKSSPSEPSDAFLAEVLNDITEWIMERFDFGEEEDAALESAVICGRGFIGIDFLPDPNRFGEIVMKEINIPVSEVHFDPAEISFETILEVFWATHDPTTLNRQGNDVGPQYRSAIFYHSDAQKEAAEKSKREVAPKLWDDPIVTEITAANKFYVAEDYHQNYFNENPNAGYCRVIINPKVKKARKEFSHLLKDNLK